MRIKFLGTHNAESSETRLASFLIDDILAIDAGGLVSGLTFAQQEKIRAILLSHGHYDHIRDLPTFAFNNHSFRTTKVFANAITSDILRSHLLDGIIYPEFAGMNSYLKRPAVMLCVFEAFESLEIEDYKIMPLPVKHPLDAVGFDIMAPDGSNLFYTGDTGPGLATLWQHTSPQLLIADVTFPNHQYDVAQASGHLCPQMLNEELIEFRRCKGYLPRVALVHLSPQAEAEIKREVAVISRELEISIHIAAEGEELTV